MSHASPTKRERELLRVAQPLGYGVTRRLKRGGMILRHGTTGVEHLVPPRAYRNLAGISSALRRKAGVAAHV